MYRREAMKNITWDMAEQFTFPVGLGAIEEVVSVKVTPQWEQSDDGQSIRLSGIYHIVASVQFNPVQQVEQVDGTYIEHIDLEHSTGYFEYALPLEIDLPSNKVVGPIKLEVSDIKALNDTASCQFVWQVQCDFADPQTALVEDDVSQEHLQSQVAEHKTVQHKPEQEQVAKLETVQHKPEQEQVAKHETVELKLEQEQAAKYETVEHKPDQEQVAHHETVEHGEPKEQLEHQEIAEHKVVQEEVAQHEIAEQKPKKPTKANVAKLKMAQLENVQQEPVTTQESSFKQPAAQHSPLQDDFFVELSDSYSVYNAKLNKIRS